MSLRLPPNVLVCLYKMFVFSNMLANERVWVYFFSIFENLLMLFIELIIIIIIKQSDKKSRTQEQNLFEVSPKSLFLIMLFDFVLG